MERGPGQLDTQQHNRITPKQELTMSSYNSGAVKLNTSAENVYSKLSNLGNLRDILERVPADSIPADKRDLFNSLNVTADSISVPAGPIGSLTFRVVERKEPSLIKLAAENSPMPMSIALNLKPETDSACTADVDIDIALPAMLKPMVGGHIQKMADQFGQVLKSIPFA